MRFALLSLLALLALPACHHAAAETEPDYLHVVLRRLPQCAYGVSFERPVRVDLLAGEHLLDTAFHAGTYMGEESLDVSLYVPEAVPGRYLLRVGLCPSMSEDPEASVACEPVEWIGQTRSFLRPSGVDAPQVVEYYRWSLRCRDGERAR